MADLNKRIFLIGSPLSASYEADLCTLFGTEGRTVAVAQLRAAGLIGLLRALWSMRPGIIVLPIEDAGSEALVSILMLLAACTRSRSICLVDHDLAVKLVSRWQITQEALLFIASSLVNFLAACRAWLELKKLMLIKPCDAKRFKLGDELIYLKTNLWFGIKAGGSVGHIAGVANGFQRNGYPVTFASYDSPPMIDKDVVQLKVGPPRGFGLPFELNNYRVQKAFQNSIETNLQLKPEQIIYQRLSVANYLGAVLSSRHKLPLVVEYNGSEVWVAKNWGSELKFHKLAELAENVMLRHAQLVVTVSDVLKDELVSRGVDPLRIVTYPNCIDSGIYDPELYTTKMRSDLRSSLNINNDAVVITFVGTFGQWHGVEVLARAVVYLAENQFEWLVSKKVHFMLVGDGFKMPTIRKILGDSRSSPFVTLTGLIPQNETPLYLSTSDIFVSPNVANSDGSKFFGSPTKLFEYMAMGKGIVASDLDQIGDVLKNSLPASRLPHIIDSECQTDYLGILCAPGSVTELAGGIRFLVDNPGFREAIGANARNEALKKYTWNHHVKAILKGLDALQ